MTTARGDGKGSRRGKRATPATAAHLADPSNPDDAVMLASVERVNVAREASASVAPAARLTLAGAESELSGITDVRERKKRARDIVAGLGLLKLPESQEWRDSLAVLGLPKKEFDDIRNDAKRKTYIAGTDIENSRGVKIKAQGDSLLIDGRPVAPIPVLHEVLAQPDADGKRRSTLYLLSHKSGSERHVISDEDLSNGRYISKLGMPIPEDRTIKESIVTAIRQRAQVMTAVSSVPRWTDGQLVLPPIEVLPSGYGATADVDETTARNAWREIAELACQENSENLALTVGAGAVSPYLQPRSEMRPTGCAITLIGVPRTGKSSLVATAAAMYGHPARLNPALSESAIAIGDALGSLGCLPLFRDEIHSANWRPGDWKTHFMRSLNGAGRRRSQSSGSGQVASTPGWTGVQFLSGNLDPRYGATDGVQARVIVLNDPHIRTLTPGEKMCFESVEPCGKCGGCLGVEPGAVSKRIVKVLLPLAYGFPLQWFMANHKAPAEFHTEYVVSAEIELKRDAPTGTGQTVAETLAMAVAGAQWFGELVGVPELRAAALQAARRVLDTLVSTLADQAVSFEDQLLADVLNDFMRNRKFWPRAEQYGTLECDIFTIHGVQKTYDGKEYLCMFPSALDEVTAGKDYEKGIALQNLAMQGKLLRDGKRMQRQLRLGALEGVSAGKDRVRLYWFARPGLDDDGPELPDAVAPAAPAPAAPAAPAPAAPAAPAPAASGPCPRCLAPGEFCGLGGTVEAATPCVCCSAPTNVVSRCGAARTAHCSGPAPAGPVAARQATRKPAGRAARPARAASESAPISHETELANLAGMIERNHWGDTPDAAELAAGLDIFHTVTSGLSITSELVSAMGVIAFHRETARHGSVPSPEEVELPEELREVQPKMLDFYHVNTGHTLTMDSPDVIVTDVNGQFLSAAGGVMLGTGNPRRVGPTDARTLLTADGKFKDIPSYGVLAGPIDLPGIWSTLQAGDTLSGQTLRYLADDKGLDVPLSDAWVWDKSRRWLGTFNALFRDARKALDAIADDTLGKRVAQAVVKGIPNTFIGGMLRSEFNRTATLRYDWAHHVIARARMNALRGTDKAAGEPLAMVADSAFFLGDDAIKGLTINRGLGKWKIERRAPMTEDIIAAYDAQRPAKLREAVRESADMAREGDSK